MVQSAAEFPIRDEESGCNSHDAAFFSRGCCCLFNFRCFKSRQSDNWERISTPIGEQECVKWNWLGKGIEVVKKAREWSELVAGPKWKTFIRRFNKTGGRARPGKFQYDPLSYSLNFNDGGGQNGDFGSELIF